MYRNTYSKYYINDFVEIKTPALNLNLHSRVIIINIVGLNDLCILLLFVTVGQFTCQCVS